MRLLTSGLLIAALALSVDATTTPDPEIDAIYGMSIAGIPIGEATLSVDVRDGTYVANGTADFGFLFFGGEGVARAEGTARNGVLEPRAYRVSYEGVRRPGRIEIDFDGGRAVRWDRLPEPDGDWAEGRTEVAAADLTGVLDPLTALVVPAPRDASPDEVCRRLLPVFSGYTRFDLELTGPAKAQTGVGCAVTYRPVAGHRADSRGVERLQRPGALTIALAPVDDAAWGPALIAVETRFGTFELVRER